MNMYMADKIIFYLWWLLINGFVYFCEFNFLSHFANPRTKEYRKALLFIYVGVNNLATALAFQLQADNILPEICHIVFLLIFSIVFLKYKWIETVAPAAIIFTLSTFTAGASTIMMRFFSATLTAPLLGSLIHGVITVLSALMFSFALLLIAKRYAFTARQTISSYLYILLLPSAFMAWGIRLGMKLQGRVSAFSSLWSIICLTGSIITFFVILHVIEKIIVLSHQVTKQALTEQYRSFQHDINNHLLVLSGLLREGEYTKAEIYLAKLHKTSDHLSSVDSTGNPILDVLMKEKINAAGEDNIAVSYSISLPPDMDIDDMDLCTIFSNAIDNAIRACMEESEGNKRIDIITSVRYQLLLIEITNPVKGEHPWKPGIGLKNIERTAQKYQGSMETVHENGFFRLSVLLCYHQNPAPAIHEP